MKRLACSGAAGVLVVLAGASVVVGTGALAGTPSQSAAAVDAQPSSAAKLVVQSDSRSAAPTPNEWKQATLVTPTRSGPRAKDCQVHQVREWLRVSCPEMVVASIAMLGGSAAEVSMWIQPQPENGGKELARGGQVIFPVAKGDARVLQFLTFGIGYEGPFTQLPALVVQERWLDDEDAPTLLLY